jgi:hypothetical protein
MQRELSVLKIRLEGIREKLEAPPVQPAPQPSKTSPEN